MEEILENIEKENSVTRGPQYHYKTEYKPYKYTTLSGMELRPYVTYRARVGTENWEIYSGGAVSVVYSVFASARRV